jgi:acyl-CoA thioesterase
MPSVTRNGRRPAEGGTSNTWNGVFTIKWMRGQTTAVIARTSVRNPRDGSSHSHRAIPATMTASTIRSSRSSSSAPRSEVRHCRRAVSPSTPSRIEAAWTKMPPTTAREAESDQAAHRPTSAVNTENTPGGMRAAASAMVMRVEIGRFT